MSVRLILLQTLLFLLSGLTLWANDTSKLKIPLARQHFHDRIDEEQRLIDKWDGSQDKQYRISSNEDVNAQAADALFRVVDQLQVFIELNAAWPSNNEKIKYLRFTEEVLQRFRISLSNREIEAADLPLLLEHFESVMHALEKKQTVLPYFNDLNYAQANLLAKIFQDNEESENINGIVYLKYCALHPEIILATVADYERQPFVDSLIKAACLRDPVTFFSYAQSLNSPLGKLITRNQDPLVRKISDLSHMPNGLFYYPFLDDLLSGKLTVDEIHRWVGDGEKGYDTVGYYKLLVRKNIEYFSRMMSPARDTPIAFFGPNGLREMLSVKALHQFIQPINELHNENNLSVRMRVLNPLSAADIYYTIVMGENDIYTSSFKHSFNRMLQKMGRPPRGDSLLQYVHFDYFRKFIKMAAGYNKLDSFLKTMPASKSEILMKAFVANLDKSENLEDAVDVADAYSSITSPILLRNIRSYVLENEKKASLEKNITGKRVYGLLGTIFNSIDSVGGKGLAEKLGISPINTLEYKSLMDDSGRVVQQIYFYGDEDGKQIFPSFINSFSTKDWTIHQKKEWVEIKSKNKRIWIFANKPLDSDASLDDSAQVHLSKYLETSGLQPSVVVHRGHSYWLPGTIKRMPENAKLVVVGSCGGYKNLHQILAKSPEAHIISTKEIGTSEINRPILNYLNQALLTGKNIEWKTMWNALSATFSKDASKDLMESWQSYISPNRNLGAIFLKAFDKISEEE